ncbi:MAG TPA: hypothetical protein VMH02_11195, partial [Verrucomicrobiae bacterium]|nr:hypothetical protein [Verrucomicrobiae bacterium]
MGGVASRPAALVPNAGSAASTTTVRGLFVSPATRGMTVNVAGPTHLSASAGLTLNASGCHGTLVTLQCALSVRDLEACPSKAPCYNAS